MRMRMKSSKNEKWPRGQQTVVGERMLGIQCDYALKEQEVFRRKGKKMVWEGNKGQRRYLC